MIKEHTMFFYFLLAKELSWHMLEVTVLTDQQSDVSSMLPSNTIKCLTFAGHANYTILTKHMVSQMSAITYKVSVLRVFVLYDLLTKLITHYKV